MHFRSKKEILESKTHFYLINFTVQSLIGSHLESKMSHGVGVQKIAKKVVYGRYIN